MADYIIIVAGGKGLRMGGNIPKQFQPLGGRPVLMHTLDKMHLAMPEACLILVLPVQQQTYWKQLCQEFAFDCPHRVADGGETRFHSVRNGLSLVPDDADGVVGVHDGVRPFVAEDVVRCCMNKARENGAAIPVVPVVETIRHLTQNISETLNRDEFRLVQTPQAFRISLLKEAYKQSYVPSFTDDASVVEALGVPVYLVEGNRENIKITTPFDKRVGEMLVNNSGNV